MRSPPTSPVFIGTKETCGSVPFTLMTAFGPADESLADDADWVLPHAESSRTGARIAAIFFHRTMNLLSC